MTCVPWRVWLHDTLRNLLFHLFFDFAKEKSFVKKLDIGGTNFWQIEQFDIV